MLGRGFGVGPAAEVSCIDLGLTRQPDHDIVLGADASFYFSNHSSVADLTEQGTFCASGLQYLGPSDQPDADAIRDFVRHAGVRDNDIVFERKLHRMQAVSAIATADSGGLSGRPSHRDTGIENVFIAGDWVGPQGHLADAAIASGRAAAQSALRCLQGGESVTDAEIERFEAERPRLRAIAYRILGTPDDADDAVQDAWLRYSTIDRSTIENLAAWLTTVVTRVSVDRLRSASHTRETYVGPWLPEPVLSEQPLGATPEDKALLAESLSIGMLAVLERLSPLERAVFILHDVFAYPLTEVAQVIERQPAATRQLAKRARDHISAERPRFARDPDDVETLTQLLMAAALEGDVETLQSYLVEDVIHISDGGAKYRAARAPIVGRERVARFFINLSKRVDPTMAFHVVRANGQLAGYITQNGEPFLLLVSNWLDGKIVASYAVRNADKLASFHRAWTASS